MYIHIHIHTHTCTESPRLRRRSSQRRRHGMLSRITTHITRQLLPPIECLRSSTVAVTVAVASTSINIPAELPISIVSTQKNLTSACKECRMRGTYTGCMRVVRHACESSCKSSRTHANRHTHMRIVTHTCESSHTHVFTQTRNIPYEYNTHKHTKTTCRNGHYPRSLFHRFGRYRVNRAPVFTRLLRPFRVVILNNRGVWLGVRGVCICAQTQLAVAIAAKREDYAVVR